MTPEQIAAGLSKAQRTAILRHGFCNWYGDANTGWPVPGRDETSFCRCGRKLMDDGLIQWASGPLDSRTRLTKLGLAVRKILETGNEPG